MRDWPHSAYLPPLAAAVAIVCAAIPVASAQFAEADQEVDFSFFQETLTRYGEWVEIRDYGLCWHPDVEDAWAPYTNGYWAYTDVGWTWVSHEPFGSIVFHYGRWILTSGGWCWVPGSEWAPAWVSWRTGGEYVGWAPLPPEVPWHPQRGISAWVDVHTEIGPAYYRFCSVRDFSAPTMVEVLIGTSLNLNVMLETRNVTNMGIRNNSIFCGGPQYRWVAQSAYAPVPVLRVNREDSVQRYYSLNIGGNFGSTQNFVYQGMLVLPGPQRVDLSVLQRPSRRRVADVSVSKGWYGDTGGNERLRSHFNREWKEREAAVSRNPSNFAPPQPEIRVKAVSAQERRSVVAEVAARGEIAPPSAKSSDPSTHSSHSPFRGQGVVTTTTGESGVASGRTAQGASAPGSASSKVGRPPSLFHQAGTNGPENTPDVSTTRSNSFPPVSSSPGGGYGKPPSVLPATRFAPPGKGTPAVSSNAVAERPVGSREAAVNTAPKQTDVDPVLPSRSGVARPQTLPRSASGGGNAALPDFDTERPRTVPVSPGATMPAQGVSRSSQPKGFPGDVRDSAGLPKTDARTGLDSGSGLPQGASPVRRSPFAGASSRNGVPTESQTTQEIPVTRQSFAAPQTSSMSSRSSSAMGQGQSQAPVSGARSSVVPPPPPPQQTAMPSSAPSSQRGFPQGGGGSGAPPARTSQPSAAPPSGSGASISSDAAPSQKKKKPGDPGYVPGQ